MYLLFLCYFISCTSNQPDLFFSETRSLVGHEKQIEGISMRYPFRIRMDDSCIYIMNLHATDYYCHQLDYPSMKYRQSWAKRGEAPGEFLDAENIRLHHTGRWMLDANNKKLVGFQNDSSGFPSKEIKLDEQLVRTLDFDIYNDSLFIVPDYTGTNRYDYINREGKIVKSAGGIPIKRKDENIPDAALAQAWRSFISYNPKNGILAMATQLGDVIELYSLPADSLVAVIRGSQGEPGFRYQDGYMIPTGIMGYSDIYVGKTNIYALFWGYTFEDLKTQKVKTEGGNILRVFDLKGNPMIQYTLDRYLTGFYINEKIETLIGLDVNSDQPVVEYKLNIHIHS